MKRLARGSDAALAAEFARLHTQLLQLAVQVGALETGFEKVLTAIGRGRVAALIEARDGAEDGRRKLEQRLRVAFGGRFGERGRGDRRRNLVGRRSRCRSRHCRW